MHLNILQKNIEDLLYDKLSDVVKNDIIIPIVNNLSA